MENQIYFMQPEKKVVKQGFVMTDEQGIIIYDAKPVKTHLFTASDFEFSNHITGNNTQHKIGHVITTEQNGVLGMFSTKSHFNFDKQNIWDYLHEQGIRIESNFTGNKIGMTYTVSLQGNEIAKISTSTPKGKSFITTDTCYQVETSKEFLDIVFLTTFAILKTDQTFYN